MLPGVLTIDAPLTTERLVLRPFVTGDLDDLLEIQSHPEVVRYLYQDVRGRDEVRAKLDERRGMTRLSADGDVVILAIEPRGGGRVVGDVMLALRSAAHRQGEIGYVLHPDAQGRGYAGEAAAAVLDLAFGRAGLHRVIGRADARNLRSLRVLRRLGLREEARFRQNEHVKGAWTDEVVMAVLADEWAARPRGVARLAGPADLQLTLFEELGG